MSLATLRRDARFTLGVLRWGLRVDAYLLLRTDQYPPYTLA